MKRQKAILTVFMLLAVTVGMTACGTAANTKGQGDSPQAEQEGSTGGGTDSAGTETGTGTTGDGGKGAAGSEASAGKKEMEAQAQSYLSEVTAAIEAQYPGETFTPISGEEIDSTSSSPWDAYCFGGGRSGSGWEFVVGILTTKENPLEGMTCGTGQGIPGYTLSQFDNGKLLLLEKGDSDKSRLSFLYDALSQGTVGVRYMKDAASRGVSLVPPENGPFLKVDMVKGGFSVTEFLPLTGDQKTKLANGTPAGKAEKEEEAAVTLLEDRSGLPAGKEAAPAVTQEMIDLAEQKCGLKAGRPADISNLTKATMELNLYGEMRQETTENRDDLDLLASQFKGTSAGDSQSAALYSGSITLTKQDGTQVTVQMSPDSESFVIGNASYYTMPKKQGDAVWSVFNTLDGWRRYGSKIRIRMTSESFPMSAQNLTFTLENETGKPIQYILSPIIYKEEDQLDENGKPVWDRIDSIAGFCGFLSPMDQDSADLQVPWNGAFVPQGPGIYKLEIQVVPEDDLRYEISDTFELTD